MSKGAAILLAIVIAIGAFLVGRLVSAPAETDNGTAEAGGEEAKAAQVEVADDVERYKVPVTERAAVQGPQSTRWSRSSNSANSSAHSARRVVPTVETDRGDVRRQGSRGLAQQPPAIPQQRHGPAAAVAMEAYAEGGNDKFWAVHDVLFANQKALGRASSSRSTRKKAGLDMDKVKRRLTEALHSKVIREDQTLASQLGANGTPYFFINGRQLRGAMPFPAFKKVIDEELATAEALTKQGVKPAQMYATLTKDGLTKAAAAKPTPQAAQPGQPDPGAVYKVPLKGDEPQKGPDDALVTIVEISDFECPFCGRVEPTLKQVLDKYGDDVRVVWLNNPLPFHKNARPGGERCPRSACAEGQRRFWAMHEKMFANQKALTTDNLEKWAKELGPEHGQVQEGSCRRQVRQEDRGAAGPGEQPRRTWYSGVLHQRPKPPRRSAARGVQDNDRRGAREGQGTRRKGHAQSEALRHHHRQRRDRSEDGTRGGQPDANKVYDIPVPKKAPTKGAKNAKVDHPGVQRLPVPLLRPRQSNDEADDDGVRRQGEARLAATTRSPSTRMRSRRRRRLVRCSRRRATRRSGRITISSSRTRRLSREKTWRNSPSRSAEST